VKAGENIMVAGESKLVAGGNRKKIAIRDFIYCNGRQIG
jgi:hypothetical protein